MPPRHLRPFAFVLALAVHCSAFAEPVKILVAYHSETGHTERLATAIAAGARSIEGVDVVLRPVDKVTDADITGADGLLVGAPVHWGVMSAEAKRFIDRVGNTLWAAKTSGEGRMAGAFATGGSDDGGLEVARLSMLAAFLGMRFIVVGSVSEDGYGRLGAEAAVAPPATAPDEGALGRARAYGARFARLTSRVRPALAR
jgi:NAD(P)H dehydrogenase (quinone)